MIYRTFILRVDKKRHFSKNFCSLHLIELHTPCHNYKGVVINLVLLQPELKAFSGNDNLQTIESLIACNKFAHDDVILLPEHFTFASDPDSYLAYIRRLAALAGCTVVGGSYNRATPKGTTINTGTIVNASGADLGSYSKLRPYFKEARTVEPGEGFGEFVINGCRVLVIICADFWYSDLFYKVREQPDIVLVPALSVSRKPEADYSQSLWRHLAITRAYEFGVYVGISDWAKDSVLPQYRTCGVGGFADPTTVDPDKMYQPIRDGIARYSIDLVALEAFREDRRMRGFFWK